MWVRRPSKKRREKNRGVCDLETMGRAVPRATLPGARRADRIGQRSGADGDRRPRVVGGPCGRAGRADEWAWTGDDRWSRVVEGRCGRARRADQRAGTRHDRWTRVAQQRRCGYRAHQRSGTGRDRRPQVVTVPCRSARLPRGHRRIRASALRERGGARGGGWCRRGFFFVGLGRRRSDGRCRCSGCRCSGWCSGRCSGCSRDGHSWRNGCNGRNGRRRRGLRRCWCRCWRWHHHCSFFRWRRLGFRCRHRRVQFRPPRRFRDIARDIQIPADENHAHGQCRQ